MRKALVMLGVMMAAFVVTAQSLSELQGRMVARRAAVLAVLASNNVGENNKGYLEILKPLADKGQEKTVADENSDRKAVYTAIADKTGAKVEAVGRNRAKDVAKVAPSGTMIQSEAGVWSAKK